MQSGDLRGLKVTESAKLIGREWKSLSASEKKVCRSKYRASSGADVLQPFDDLGAQDMARYTQERKTVLNKDVIHQKSTT